MNKIIVGSFVLVIGAFGYLFYRMYKKPDETTGKIFSPVVPKVTPAVVTPPVVTPPVVKPPVVSNYYTIDIAGRVILSDHFIPSDSQILTYFQKKGVSFQSVADPNFQTAKYSVLALNLPETSFI